MQQYKRILGKVMMTAEGTYDSNKGYDPISLITDEETGKSYISRKEVPAGTQINNREYWQPVASSGIIDNGVIILNRKNSDGQVPIYDLKSAAEAVAVGDRKGGVILGFLGFNPEIDTVPTWKLYQYNDVSPSNWINIDYWLPMDYTNKYAGWFDNEEALYDSVPFPKVGMYAYVGNSATSAIIYRCYVDRTWQATEDKAFGGVVNLADEEDITSKQNKLKFKDKEYNPAQYNGMGRIYLRKNIVGGINVLTQTMIEATNTTYIIQYDYDLQSQTIIIPENSILQFEGGSFSNGIISGSQSNIISNDNVIFNNITIEGVWKVNKIYSKWFDFNNNENANNIKNFRNLVSLSSDDYYGEIYIDVGNYYASIESNGNYIMSVNNNTKIILNGNIILNGCSFGNYSIININNKNNIIIEGTGSIIGDVDTHIGSGGEWGMGINILNGKNIKIEGIYISKCWGDGVYIGQVSNNISNYAENVYINNIVCDDNRRQGLSIIAGKNLTINDSKFINTGQSSLTAPGAGIDIEPNEAENSILENINISNCYFNNNAGGNSTSNDLLLANVNNTLSIFINNCILKGGISLLGTNIEKVIFSNCEIRYVKIQNVSTLSNVILKDCNLESLSSILNYRQGLILINVNNIRPIYNKQEFTFEGKNDYPIFKLTFTNLHDALYVFTIQSPYNKRNMTAINKYYYSCRFVTSAVFRKEYAEYFRTSNEEQSINVDQLYNNGIFMSNPILNEDNTYSIYVKLGMTGISGNVSILFESYTNAWLNDAYRGNTYFNVENVTIADIPEEAYFNSAVKGLCHGSHNYSFPILTPAKGAMFYSDTMNKMLFGNGTTWATADGTPVS